MCTIPTTCSISAFITHAGLEEAATNSWNALNGDIIVNSWYHVKDRAEKCLLFRGGHFEGETNPPPVEE